MTRDDASRAVLEAQERFRARVAGVTSSERNAIVVATRQLALDIAPVDVTKSLALSELAELLEVPRAHRAPTSIGREPEPRYTQPPDMEGDEYLRARSPRAIRRPPSRGD